MILRYYILFVMLLVFNLEKAQNLVPNPSFEDTTSCPTGAAQLTKAQYWTYPSQGSSDYFNNCSTANSNAVHVPNNGIGTQIARTGNAYAGFYVAYKYQHNYNREYIQAQLTSSLVANEKYLVSFYVSLADNPEYAVSSIGAYFSNTQLSVANNNLLPYSPQVKNPSTNPLVDKTNWMLVSDTLYAEGGEQFITIGNFMPDSLSDTLYVGPSTGWFSSYYYIDDISVLDAGPMGVESFAKQGGATLYPNPISDVVHIETRLQNAEVKIYDVLGNEMLSQKLSSNKQVDVSLFPRGIYFLRLQESGKVYSAKFIKK